jgi:hypothetical protein
MRITGWRREVVWRMNRDEAQRVAEALETADNPEAEHWAFDLRRQGDVSVSA